MFVKVCGITCLEDAKLALELGVDAIGVNLIESSARWVGEQTARQIADAVRGRLRTVAVVATHQRSELDRLCESTGVDWLQLHGGEQTERLDDLPSYAFLAVRIGDLSDVERARSSPGDPILVDAKVPGMLGGTGVGFDWGLVQGLASERRLILAGGLGPDNVAEAVSVVKPWGVDVASGVQVTGNPRRKDRERVQRFVQAARAAG
jgi:phosphoribosylanthranilate isomerase